MSNESRLTANCPACGGSQTRYYAQKGGYSLTKCFACTFIFVDPLPPSDVLEKTGYKNRKENISKDYFPKAKLRNRRAMFTATSLWRFIRNKDVVDIACGGGFIVDAMRRLGGRAVGIDINADRISYAVRHFPENQFICGGYEELLRRRRSFDFIYSSQLLEHLPDINNFMEVLSQITRPHGYIYIKTPDRDHWRAPDVTSPDVPGPPIRKCYFNKKSLASLLERYGFQIKRVYFKMKPSLHILAQKTDRSPV
jgi:SAM-dependent methyltransferase